MNMNEYFPAESRDGIRTLAFPVIQTASMFYVTPTKDGQADDAVPDAEVTDLKTGFWTETFFTTDPSLLPTIAKMSAMVPDGKYPEGADVKAKVSQRTLMRVYGWDREADKPLDHSAYVNEGENLLTAATRVAGELILIIRAARRGKVRDTSEYLQ